MPRYEYLTWDVTYEPGKLEARGFNGDQQVAVDVVETTGPAASIRLVADRMNLIADREDQLPVEVSILDAEGRVVPTADNEVVFTLVGAGTVAGVGNGDPACHEPDKADRRSAFNGHCMVIVQAGGEAGSITLTAAAKGLPPATLELTSKPAMVPEL
jgi:beta-galactosidase